MYIHYLLAKSNIHSIDHFHVQ